MFARLRAFRLRGWFDRDGWNELWQAVYLATLLVGTVVALFDGERSAGERAAIGLLSAAAGVWYLLIVRRRYWQATPARFAVLMAIAAVLWFPLVILHPAFGWTIPAAYGVASCAWLRRSIASVVVLSVLVLLADQFAGDEGIDAGRVVFVVTIGLFVLLSHATIGAISRESERRHQLIVELESTRAELAASERSAGALAERERLAREIHDALAQGLTSIVMLLEAADAKLPAGSAEARAALDQALQTARESLAEARRIVWALGPDSHRPGALVASLEGLADQVTLAGDIEMGVVVTGEPSSLDANRELAVLRTAQEALTNARRHGHPSHITLTLSWLGDSVILDVADDGQGFVPGETRPRPGGGLGLSGLERRAADAGGELTVDSAPGHGTTVTLQLPLDADPVETARGKTR